MKKLSFIHQKEFSTPGGKIVRMKALVTIHGIQFVECYENDHRYPATEIQEIINQ